MFLNEFKNLFQLSKTLRFALEPIGKTRENFEKYIYEKDELRATKFKVVKKYCDEYHRKFIEDCLSDFSDEKFNLLLNQYYQYFIASDKDEKAFDKIKTALRKIISERFTKNDNYKKLLGKEMINDFLKAYYKDDVEKLEDVELFYGFATYFKGYNENRKNMYSLEEKHTAIAYRLIDENLPTFIKNMQDYKKIIEKIPSLKNEIKDALGIDTDVLFSDIKNFSNCITQKQIESYNKAIGGVSLQNGVKIQGINEKVNLYKQQTKEKLPLLKILYKQILSNAESNSFVIDKIEDDKELIGLINSTYENISDVLNKEEFLNVFKEFNSYDLSKIWIDRGLSLTSLSQSAFGNWGYIDDLLSKEYIDNYKGKEERGSEKYNKKKEETLKKEKILSIARIKELIENYASEKGDYLKLSNFCIENFDKLVSEIKAQHEACLPVLKFDYEEKSKNLIQKDEKIELIKNLLDSIKNLQMFIRTFIPKDTSLPSDTSFYNSLYYDELCEITGTYNKARNYLTQKPYSVEKFPLTLNCPTWADGWDRNKEESNLTVLLKEGEKYYLGIMKKEQNKIFKTFPSGSNNYQKIEYKLLPGPNKMLPKVFFSDKNIQHYNPSQDLLKKYDAGCHKKGDNFDQSFCHELIDFFKESIEKHEDWKNFNFKFSNTNSYEDISGFYREVEEQGYKLSYQDVSKEYVDNLVEEGRLFLFQIYSKDFSEHSHGAPNLHTLYFKALFDEENLSNVVYKLNGEAEIFYRKKSLEAKITHPANVPMENKNDKTKTRTLKYDLIKDKRFTLDKFLFHVPITLNFKAIGVNKFNDYTNERINASKDDIHIIGIDRGERNLIYLSVINQKGEIIEQISLNEISSEYQGEIYKKNYHDLLDKKEKDRDNARRSWKTVGNIKDLKEGYMSQVIRKVADLVIKYNAIIVLEDLNGGFINSRKKVEKQVYSKFETMLINKLSYLVNKNLNPSDMGGVLNAYQLANPSIKGRQNGIIFYVPAYNTSKIDPVTGFVNMFNTRYTNEKEAKSFIEKFKSIRFNSEEDYFEFNFDYRDFSDKSSGNRKEWTVCTYKERIRTYRNPAKNNEYDNEEVNLTKEFKNLFEKYKIDINNLQQEILSKADAAFYSATKEKNGFYGFFKLFGLMLQMRNSVQNSEIDYIISPVKSKKGSFFDSRESGEFLPKDADANGAYNIARKGLILLSRIKQNPYKLDCKITNEEYYNYVQARDL